NAVGLQARSGANDGDEILQLGGAQAEYAACPTTLVLPHFFDFAAVPLGVEAGTVSTTLVLVPCGADILGAAPSPDVVQFLVHNEFAQRFSTSRTLFGQQAIPLSRIDTTQRQRSIFSAGIEGTLTGQTVIDGIDTGALGVAVEAHQLTADAMSTRHTALPL